MSDNNNTFDELQKLYTKGFRCIKYEDKAGADMDVYLKNFESEESRHMKITNNTDKAYITNYINNNIMIR